MTKSTRDSKSVVQKTLLLLRADAKAHDEGSLIGSEDELLARYEVSRPTLRQAAALVAQEQLIRVRRGTTGGYFATRPTVSAVSHMAAIYLQTRNTGLDDMLASVERIRRDMVRLAAGSRDGDAKAGLARFLDQDEAAQASDYNLAGFVAAERAYALLLGRLCGSEVLNLFLQILLDLIGMPAPDQRPVLNTPLRLETAAQRRGRVIRAVLAGDADTAAREVEEGIRQFARWATEDRGGNGRRRRPAER
jgi:GntR family transcriptional repressor for pyruvate dehydrogenase complex